MLVVLFIIMAVTILSLGFLARSDVEMLCGKNMVTYTQVGYLSESGLEHCKALVLNPHDLSSDFSTPFTAQDQQLDGDSDDYYNITIKRDANYTERCNYIFTSTAYREKAGQRFGNSVLRADFRVDPAIALWCSDDTVINGNTSIYGDVYCGNELDNNGDIKGDIFAELLTGTGSKAGQLYEPNQTDINSPDLDMVFFVPTYVPDANGNVEIDTDTIVKGSLIIDANLIIKSGCTVEIDPGKNEVGLFVTGSVDINDLSTLQVEGLAKVKDSVIVRGSSRLEVTGALFVGTGGLRGSGMVTLVADPIAASIKVNKGFGDTENYIPAAGGFFKKIERSDQEF